MANLYTQKESNIRKTWLLIATSLLLLMGVGWLLGYYLGDARVLYGFVFFSIALNLVAYWQSDKIALAMSGAKPVTREQSPYLYRLIENLCLTAGLPLPRVYLIPSAQINAFATGRNPQHAAVAVTQGALEKLPNEELEGVLAHEISHIGNRDILISTIVVVLAGIISMAADIFLRVSFWGGRDDDHRGSAVQIIVVAAAILAPLAALLIQLAVSRKREFLADASGALLTRYPEGLANALEKIGYDQIPMRHAHMATAHLFLANPFKGRERGNWLTKLFMTHPPLTERIKILRGMRV